MIITVLVLKDGKQTVEKRDVQDNYFVPVIKEEMPTLEEQITELKEQIKSLQSTTETLSTSVDALKTIEPIELTK